MNFNITTLATAVTGWLAEAADQEETSNTSLVASVALGALGAMTAYVFFRRFAVAQETFNLRGTPLVATPDVSHNPYLQTLDLSRTQITVTPDVSHNPRLECLYLNDTLITIAPGVSQNPCLETLYLSNTQIDAAPDVSQNPRLEILNLWRTPITAAPDVSQNPHLRTLDLSWTQIVAAPDVSQNPLLERLDLSRTQIAIAPDVSQNPRLQLLDLSHTQIAIAPDVSQNPRLQILHLWNTQIAIAPDVSHNPDLRRLYLNNNQLTQLHDSIFSLPRDCEVYAEYNLFTPEYAAAFQQRLLAHREAHPDQGPTVSFSIHDDAAPAAPISLEQQLAGWSQRFESAYPQAEHPELWAEGELSSASLNSLEEDVKAMLANYLRRLEQIKDYKNGGSARNNVILRVERMIRLATQNPTFRNEMLALIAEGLQTCGDRVQIIFDEIEILWQLNQKKSSPEEFRALAIRAERWRQVGLHAEIQAEERGFGDHIETILYYQIHLRDALDLPISTQNMLYPGVSGVTEEMLEAAKSEIEALSDEELLASSHHWQAYVQNRHKDPVENITNDYGNLLADFGDYIDLENEDEKNRFLEENQNLADLIGQALSLEIPIEYFAMTEFIAQKRQEAIASLEKTLIQ